MINGIMKLPVCILAASLAACTSSDNPHNDSAPFYRMSTEFQGPTLPLSVKSDEDGDFMVLLSDLMESDSSQLWTLTPQGDGFFRVGNLTTGTQSSLTVGDGEDRRPLLMSDTADGSAQLWQVIPLDNGFCQIKSQLLGQTMALDVVAEAPSRRVNMAPAGFYSGQHWQLINASTTPADDTLARCIGNTDVTTNAAGFIPTENYRTVNTGGFQLLISPKLDVDSELTATILREMDDQIAAIEQVLPEVVVAELQTIRIWIELEARDNGIAEFHESVEYLRENGYNPDKVGAVEISNAGNFVEQSQTLQPWIMLHELAHAWHYTYPYLDSAILEAFDKAVASGNYESVEYVDGSLRRAYAMENHKEYFAELSEAYFGTNDFFPFNRDQLLQFDSEGYAMIKSVWGL